MTETVTNCHDCPLHHTLLHMTEEISNFCKGGSGEGKAHESVTALFKKCILKKEDITIELGSWDDIQTRQSTNKDRPEGL